MTQQKRALRIAGVQEKTGLARSTIYALEADGKFPQHFKLSERASGWWEHEVDQFLEARATTTRQVAELGFNTERRKAAA